MILNIFMWHQRKLIMFWYYIMLNTSFTNMCILIFSLCFNNISSYCNSYTWPNVQYLWVFSYQISRQMRRSHFDQDLSLSFAICFVIKSLYLFGHFYWWVLICNIESTGPIIYSIIYFSNIYSMMIQINGIAKQMLHDMKLFHIYVEK